MLFSIATVQSGDNDVPGVSAFIKKRSLQAVGAGCVDERGREAKCEGEDCRDY